MSVSTKRWRVPCAILALIFTGGGILTPLIVEYRIKHTPDALLFRAIEDGSVERVRYWLQRGANPNAIGEPSRKTGLVFWYSRIKSPEYLDETTPLMHAVDSPPIVQLLLNSGADPHGVNENALLFATRRDDAESLRLLLKTPFPSAALQSALSTAVWCGYRDLFPILLQHGARINGASLYGMAPLFEAMMVRRWSDAEYLLSLGADINLPETKEGQTALVRVTLIGSVESVSWLLKHKAKVNLRDKRGYTALYYARRFKREGRGAKSAFDADRNYSAVAAALQKAGGVE